LPILIKRFIFILGKRLSKIPKSKFDMSKKNKLILSTLIFLAIFFKFKKISFAVCPVCTVAVGVGLGLSRFLGIDDTITGIWIGGIILSGGFWLSAWIEKRGWKIPYKDLFCVGFLFLLVILPLYFTKVVGIPGNTFWGIDKLILGIGTGSFLFLLGVLGEKELRKKNQGKVFFYYQKVVIPVSLLILATLFFYLAINRV